jgi:uncharacterized protein YoxC
MAVAKISIDVSEAKETIEQLNADIDDLSNALSQIRIAANKAKESMREFNEACKNITITS